MTDFKNRFLVSSKERRNDIVQKLTKNIDNILPADLYHKTKEYIELENMKCWAILNINTAQIEDEIEEDEVLRSDKILTFYKDNMTSKPYEVTISKMVKEFISSRTAKLDMNFDRRFLMFITESQQNSSIILSDENWRIIYMENNKQLNRNQKSKIMKAKIEAFKKENTSNLEKLLASKETAATEKAAIRAILKERKAEEEASDAADAPVENTPKVVTKKSTKAPVVKKEKAAKKPGVIQTICDSIGEKPITEAKILAKLKKAFPDKQEKSMMSTIKVQIGTNKQPTRMERERKITFVITKSDKGIKSYSLK